MKYQDYVIKDGQFIGRFEEMYRDVSDPWHCSSTVDGWWSPVRVPGSASSDQPSLWT